MGRKITGVILIVIGVILLMLFAVNVLGSPRAKIGDTLLGGAILCLLPAAVLLFVGARLSRAASGASSLARPIEDTEAVRGAITSEIAALSTETQDWLNKVVDRLGRYGYSTLPKITSNNQSFMFLSSRVEENASGCLALPFFGLIGMLIAGAQDPDVYDTFVFKAFDTLDSNGLKEYIDSSVRCTRSLGKRRSFFTLRSNPFVYHCYPVAIVKNADEAVINVVQNSPVSRVGGVNTLPAIYDQATTQAYFRQKEMSQYKDTKAFERMRSRMRDILAFPPKSPDLHLPPA